MNYAPREEDELDFDQVDGAYDGSEYKLDEFGEQIGASTDDMIEDDIVADNLTAKEATPAETKIENGFGEIINPANSEHLTDQIDDHDLSHQAESDIAADPAKPDTTPS